MLATQGTQEARMLRTSGGCPTARSQIDGRMEGVVAFIFVDQINSVDETAVLFHRN